MPVYTEPEWSSTIDLGYEERSYFDKKTPSPFDVTAVLVRLIRYNFGDASRILNTSLQHLVWNSDPVQSEIQIAPGFTRNVKNVLKKPALFINRGQVNVIKLPNLENEAGIAIRLSTQAVSNSNPTQIAYLSGSHNIICEGLAPIQCELLAEEVFLRLLLFSTVIKRDFNLKSFNPATEGAISPMQEREDRPIKTYIASVTFSWSVDYMYNTQTEAPV